MSIDGANIGVTPTRCLETILGDGTQPSADEERTPEQLEAYINEVGEPHFHKATEHGYNDTCRYLAKHMLAAMRATEETLDMVGAYRKAKNRGMKNVDPSGFQVGWAFNAARTILGLPEAENPAIVEFSRKDF